MALNKSALQSDLADVFSSMESNSDFASGIASACKSYIENGEVTTEDEGTVSSGEFAGSGSGSVTVTDTLMSAPILTATASMQSMTEGGDAVLASAIFSGLNAMIAVAVVETDVTGETTSPSGSPVPPSSGNAKGVGLSCTDSGFVSALEGYFSDMQSMTEGGDDYFAEKLADVIHTYISTGKVTTSGLEALSGSAGSGEIA
jgi:hypothetical protein